ncbi:MAG: hypothetical protein RL154_55 [Pseudomonadota bacterium]|jgi:PAS domain S-box-containing protein
MAEYLINTSKLIVSKTDVNGEILQANDAFCEVSGYQKQELIGQPHNLVRHTDMPKIVFKLLWVKLLDAQEVYAFVKNMRKNGDYYWVYATVTPQLARNGEIVSFTSVRKKPNRKAIEIIEPFYKTLSALEEPHGYGQSALKLKELLNLKQMKYNKLISSLQISGKL